MTVTLKERLEEFERTFGSAREPAFYLGIDPSYWSRLKNGDKVNPSDDTLEKLGLIRVVTYELRKPLSQRRKDERPENR